MDTDELQTGHWYRLQVPVQTTRSYQGKLVRKIETKDGTFVLMFQGRSAFSVVSDEVLEAEEVQPTSTGVPRE